MFIAIAGPLVYIFYALTDVAKGYLIWMLVFSCFYMFAFAYNTIFTAGGFPAGGDAKYDAVSVFFAVMEMLNLTVLLSANLGVMNLLPFPALDGGRLVFLIVEMITKCAPIEGSCLA